MPIGGSNDAGNYDRTNRQLKYQVKVTVPPNFGAPGQPGAPGAPGKDGQPGGSGPQGGTSGGGSPTPTTPPTITQGGDGHVTICNVLSGQIVDVANNSTQNITKYDITNILKGIVHYNTGVDTWGEVLDIKVGARGDTITRAAAGSPVVGISSSLGYLAPTFFYKDKNSADQTAQITYSQYYDGSLSVGGWSGGASGYSFDDTNASVATLSNIDLNKPVLLSYDINAINGDFYIFVECITLDISTSVYFYFDFSSEPTAQTITDAQNNQVLAVVDTTGKWYIPVASSTDYWNSTLNGFEPSHPGWVILPIPPNVGLPTSTSIYYEYQMRADPADTSGYSGIYFYVWSQRNNQLNVDYFGLSEQPNYKEHDNDIPANTSGLNEPVGYYSVGFKSLSDRSACKYIYGLIK